MPNTLDWVGDGDDVDVVESLEEALEVSFSNAELTAVKTVGDLHDLVMRKLPPDREAKKCAGAMTFYRLRGVLRDMVPGARISPSTDIKPLVSGRPKSFFKEIERKSGLRLGRPDLSWVGDAGGVLVLIPFLALLPAIVWGGLVHPLPKLGFALVGSLVVGLLLLRADGGRVSGTVGDLARKTSRLNYGQLTKQGARVRETEVWSLLTEMLTSDSCLKPEEVTRETVFFRSQLKTA